MTTSELARPRDVPPDPRSAHPVVSPTEHTDLLGVPRTVLTELTELRRRAHERALTLAQWRTRHAAVLATVPAAPDPAQVAVLRELAIDTALAAEDRAAELVDTSPSSHSPTAAERLLADVAALTTATGARACSERMWSLHRDLVVLEGPPTDRVVIAVLPECDRDKRASLVNHSPRTRVEIAARLDEDERLHQAWLAEVRRTAPAPTDHGEVHRLRAASGTRALAGLLGRRPELSGVHAPADLLTDMVTWSA
ncbi:MAG: hypothetical protein JWR20_1522 [Marmoricola sp.]|nr:hypothetical protein [Marmoricola sp.]